MPALELLELLELLLKGESLLLCPIQGATLLRFLRGFLVTGFSNVVPPLSSPSPGPLNN